MNNSSNQLVELLLAVISMLMMITTSIIGFMWRDTVKQLRDIIGIVSALGTNLALTSHRIIDHERWHERQGDNT